MVNNSNCQGQIKLSMIVPVYGVEAYIHRFLDSLAKNLHSKMEVILVNDGTKDRCGEILDAYQKQYPQSVRVIHKKNDGVSSARNEGLAVASGEYLLFADPDDQLEEGYTETILDAIEKYHRPDMILFDYYRRKKGENKYKQGCGFAEGVVEHSPFLYSFTQDREIPSFLWNKVIRRDVCIGQWFDMSVRLCEDAKWLTDIALASSNIVYVKKAIYYYEIREGSLCRVSSHIDVQKCVEIFRERCEKYEPLIGKVNLCAPIRFMIEFCILGYRGRHTEDVSHYERIICDNLVKCLMDKGLSGNNKKRVLLIALGLAKYYYRKK